MTSIRKSFTSGILYTGVAKYSGVIISIVIGAILARLLSPEEFGIVALVTVFVSFFTLLSDFGLGPAVVQNQTLSSADVKSIFSFSILIGLLLSLLFFLSAPLIANFYNEPELVKVSRLLSLAILFHSLQIIPRSLLQKDLKFKQLGIITVVLQLITGAVAIFLAYIGFSYYALVIKSILLGAGFMLVFYILRPIKITWRINFLSIKKIIRFSSFQFMFNFINYFSRNADNILIGKYLGTAPLGYYEKSYRLMLLPVQNLTHVITPVMMPVLSKYQNNKTVIFNTYLKVVKILSLIGFPLSVFLYFSAPEIINIIFGPQWGQSIPVFKILALTVGIQMVLSSTGSIFQAVNRTDLLFISGLLSAVTMVGGIFYGIFVGESLLYVGYGLIIAFSINFFQGFYFLIKKALGNSLLKFLKVFLFPLLIAVILFPVNYAISFIDIQNHVLSLITKLLSSGVVFSLVYFSSAKNRKFIKSFKKE